MTVQLAQIFETTETPTKASVYLKRGGSNSGSAFDIDLPKSIDSTNFKTIEQRTHKLILSEDSQQTGDGVLSIEPFGPETFANNKSIAFNGTNAQSQLTVEDAASLSFGATGLPGGEPSFSWSAWVKPTDLDKPFIVASKILTGGSGDEYCFGHIPFVGLVLLIADGAGFSGGYIAQANVSLTEDAWQHVCATYDGSRVPGGIKLYLNGTLATSVGLSPGSYTAMSNSSADLVIGRRWSGLTTNVAEGFIDEIAAFDKELSAAEVSELYNSAKTFNLNTFSAKADLVSWWRMGDKASGTAPDYTIPDQIGDNDAKMEEFQGDSTSGVVQDAVAETPSTISGVLYPIVHYPVKTTNPGRFFVHMRVKSPSGNLQVSLLIDDVIIKKEAFSLFGWAWIMMEFTLADIDIHRLGIRLEENSSAIDKLYISDDNDPMSGNGPDFTDSPFITVHMQVYETNGVDTPTNPLKIYDFKNTIDEIAVDDWYNFNISVIDSSISVNFMGRFALVMSSSGGSDDNYVIWELVDNDEYVLLPSAIRI